MRPTVAWTEELNGTPLGVADRVYGVPGCLLLAVCSHGRRNARLRRQCRQDADEMTFSDPS